MSQQSEERLPESASSEPAGAPSARILHLKGRQYDLQKAIQQRAQESVEREAALDHEERRPKPLKWLVALSIAAVPILLTLFAVDSFLTVFHKYLGTVSDQIEQQQAYEAAEAAAAAAAAEEEAANQARSPDVVMLQPMNIPEQKPNAAAPQQPPTASAPDTKK